MKKLILIGGNRDGQSGPLRSFAQMAQARGIAVEVVSEPWHLAMAAKDGVTLEAALNEAAIPLRCLEKISAESFKDQACEDSVCLLVNAIWFIKQDIIDLFPGRIFNYHNALLPQERGAAAYSWKILSGTRMGGLSIHEVVEELDQGRVVFAHAVEFPDSARHSMDFYKHIEAIEPQFFSDFLTHLEAATLPEKRLQDEALSLYWPRLNSDVHGYIDWNWQARDIEAFSNAFDEPHPGASSFLDGVRFRLKGCCLSDESIDFHPFQAGIDVL
ncbi:MAG: hypothetical protein HQ514_10750 [Rhodospirillales bacterium]|nr:hypothetical protein [Rhodospirillales bacterium]